MSVSLRQLRAMLGLVEQRSFTRAAAQMHLSQPAFSALIRSLEDEVAMRLFDRTTRHVELTVEGRDFADSARRVLAEVENAVSGMRDASALRRGRVSLAVLPSLAADWLPDVLADFRAAHPDIELEIADVLSEPCIERVAAGRADFALAAIRADTPELRAERFCSDDFHLVCRADHPLAKAARIQPRDLANWPFVHLARSSSVRQYLDAAFYPQTMNTLMEVEQLATVMGMVRAGLGVSVVPALTLFHFRRVGLITRPLRLSGLKRQIFMVRRRDRSLSLAAQALYQIMRAHKPKDRAKLQDSAKQSSL